MNMMDDRYIPLSQVAKFLGVAVKTAIGWLSEYGARLIEVQRGDRRMTLVWKPDLDRFIEEHTVKPEPKPEPKRRGRPPKLQLAKQG
jgi:hypothetical protein